jgi:3-hydroxyacyl-[acyl-carrier-protein] dehydratase
MIVGVKESRDFMRLLRQRFPFLMMERIILWEPGKTIEGIKKFSNDDMISGFAHTQIPLFVFIETLGQLSEVLIRASDPGFPNSGKLAAINSFEVLDAVSLDDSLRIKSSLENHFGHFYQTQVKAYVNDKLIIRGVLVHVFQ